MFRIVLFVLAVLSVAVPASAADVAGDWKVVGKVGEFPVDIVCSFKQAGTKLTGACRGMDIGELPLTGESDGPAATWNYTVNFQGQALTVVYTAKMNSASAMTGDISVMGNAAGSFTASKQ